MPETTLTLELMKIYGYHVEYRHNGECSVLKKQLENGYIIIGAGDAKYPETMSEPVGIGFYHADGKLMFDKNFVFDSLKIFVEVEATLAEAFGLNDEFAVNKTPDLQERLYRMLLRLTEKVERANSIQHSGGKILSEDWAELFQMTNEARGILAETGRRMS